MNTCRYSQSFTFAFLYDTKLFCPKCSYVSTPHTLFLGNFDLKYAKKNYINFDDIKFTSACGCKRYNILKVSDDVLQILELQ